ncbi:unnamed protein product, partial [Closterium sp. Naga37s-1]
MQYSPLFLGSPLLSACFTLSVSAPFPPRFLPISSPSPPHLLPISSPSPPISPPSPSQPTPPNPLSMAVPVPIALPISTWTPRCAPQLNSRVCRLCARLGSARLWDDTARQNIDHNVPGGKLNRGLSVVDTVGILKGGFDKLSEDEVFKASAVGWCIEWLQAYFLVVDDIMDSSITRRGQPCWYRMDKVGMIAINDGVLLNSHIFLILRRHFSSHPAYTRLLDLFNEVTYQTACGQMLDLITTPEGEVDLNKYTMSTYLKIVQYKTAYYSFYLPVATALILAGVEDAALAAQGREILVVMGTYFQVQDDVLDCYGDPAVIGKVGTDIEDTKCSWLVVQALQRATQEQRQIIESNYGKKDEKCVAVIKQLYTEMKLQDAFAEYEKESHASITAAIAQVESEPLR